MTAEKLSRLVFIDEAPWPLEYRVRIGMTVHAMTREIGAARAVQEYLVREIESGRMRSDGE
ncbi:MAG TPA: hypothetical protein VLL76_08840 [Candidatus Omnitrophota bacterium]|nr:hypothetical protein [Candidatus Omnitrophota bacterium]